jgi:Ca2+-binding RTX toxin-like protein/uncharacterized protein (DUF302 family)
VEVTPTAGAWKAVDIDLSAFTKIDKSKIIQVKLDTGIQPTTKVMYFDNIYFGKAALADAPTTAPTAPTALAADVVSLYSDAYTTTAGFDLPYWGQSKMVADTTIASNKVLKGDAFTYQGFQFDPINATTKGLLKLHLDIWSADATPVKVYVISAGQDSEYVEVTPTAGAWKAVDIDLSAFTKIDKSKIIQVKLDTGISPTTKVMYFDNIYFGKAAPPKPVEFSGLDFEGAPAGYVVTGFEGAAVELALGPDGGSNHVLQYTKAANAKFYSGAVLGTKAGYLGDVIPLDLAAGKTAMSAKVWVPKAGTVVRLQVADSAAGDDAHYVEAAATATAVGWNSLVFDFAKPVARTVAAHGYASEVTALVAGVSYDKLSIFVDYGNGRAYDEAVVGNPPSADVKYYIDDVKVVTLTEPNDPLFVVASESSKSVTTVVVSDALLGPTPKFALSGADASLFKVSNKGVLSFTTFRDFEQPSDADQDNVYEVSVAMTNAKTGYRVLKDFSVEVELTPILGTSANDNLRGTVRYDTLDGLGGNDKLTGHQGLDTFLVTSGRDSITDFNWLTKGESGSEILKVSAGATADVTLLSRWLATNDSINEGTANISALGFSVDLSAIEEGQGWSVTNKGAATTITGSQFDDSLYGGARSDTLDGGEGDDLLSGGKGADSLTGGGGSDIFRLSGENKADRITDFVSGDDHIQLDHLIFKKLVIGELSEDQFVVGAKALTKTQRVVYDEQEGALYYDADGSGRGAAILIGVLENNAYLAIEDLTVI